jgi:hypothetical protein
MSERELRENPSIIVIRACNTAFLMRLWSKSIAAITGWSQSMIELCDRPALENTTFQRLIIHL